MPFDLDARIGEWRKSLLDASKRNRLIDFRTGGSGGLALAHPEPSAVWTRLVAGKGLAFAWKRDLIAPPPVLADAEGEDRPTEGPTGVDSGPGVTERCRVSPRLRDHHLLTDLEDRRLATRLTGLARKARESQAEQGSRSCTSPSASCAGSSRTKAMSRFCRPAPSGNGEQSQVSSCRTKSRWGKREGNSSVRPSGSKTVGPLSPPCRPRGIRGALPEKSVAQLVAPARSLSLRPTPAHSALLRRSAARNELRDKRFRRKVLPRAALRKFGRSHGDLTLNQRVVGSSPTRGTR
jgi:hypothetical protein